MSATTKFVGLVAGFSAVAAIGVAIAQGVPPNPFITNPALGAGQQSTHITSMGETGVPGMVDSTRMATITREEEVAAVAPAAPAPAVIAQQTAPEPAESTTMGAAPAQPEAPAPVRITRQDRN